MICCIMEKDVVSTPKTQASHPLHTQYKSSVCFVIFVRCCMMLFFFVQSYCCVGNSNNTLISSPFPPHRLHFAVFLSPVRHLPRLRLLSPRTNWGGCSRNCRWIWNPGLTRGGTITVAA